MKKRLLIFSLLAILSSMLISAQTNAEEVIYLKNGTIYRAI
jgi:hypothetical protein